MKPVPNDPVIDEIREIRHTISERCNHDPAQIVAYYMKRQEQHRDRLVSPSPPVVAVDASMIDSVEPASH